MEIKKLIPPMINNVKILTRDNKNKINLTFIYANKMKRNISISAVIKNYELFVAGISIFACEGSRKPSGKAKEVEIINSDPIIINTFLDFLEMLGFPRNRCKAKVQLTLAIYDDET